MRKQKKWVKRRGKVQVRRMWQLFGLTHLSANRASCCRWSRGGASLLLHGAYLGGRTVCPEGEGSDLAPWFMSKGDKTDGDSGGRAEKLSQLPAMSLSLPSYFTPTWSVVPGNTTHDKGLCGQTDKPTSSLFEVYEHHLRNYCERKLKDSQTQKTINIKVAISPQGVADLNETHINMPQLWQTD